ncbi:MAG: hypothetical protein AAGE65_14730, partial [Planctomycetota bacterium]
GGRDAASAEWKQMAERFPDAGLPESLEAALAAGRASRSSWAGSAEASRPAPPQPLITDPKGPTP